MISAFQLRKLAFYAIIVPLALVVGFFVSQPESPATFVLLSGLLMIGLMPLLMRWHHVLLIVTWNATLNAFFLPGQPELWMVIAVLSLMFSFWRRSLDNTWRFEFFSSTSLPLLLMALVVVVTAKVNGGLGFRSLGSSMFGSKKYASILCAIIGFFALSSQKIPRKRALLYASLFFLSGATAIFSDVVYAAGPSFYFLFYLFPSSLAMLQASSDAFFQTAVFRIEGAAWASIAMVCFMLLRYGIRGIFTIRRPGRFLFFIAFVLIGLLGGFRSRFAFLLLLFVVQFYFEGLFKEALFPLLLGFVIAVAAITLPFAQSFPQPVQRALSFLPIDVDPMVKQDARASTEWRVEMWRVLLPEIPKYFWLGKGYVISPADMYLTEYASNIGRVKDYEAALVVGNYHNGPLTLQIPLGVFGSIAFLWFLIVGGRVLYRNFRFGDPGLKNINTFLLSFFLVKTIFFFVITAAFDAEFFVFAGTVALSLSLNWRDSSKKDAEAQPVLKDVEAEWPAPQKLDWLRRESCCKKKARDER